MKWCTAEEEKKNYLNRDIRFNFLFLRVFFSFLFCRDIPSMIRHVVESEEPYQPQILNILK